MFKFENFFPIIRNKIFRFSWNIYVPYQNRTYFWESPSSSSERSPKKSTSTYWIERTNQHPPSVSPLVAQNPRSVAGPVTHPSRRLPTVRQTTVLTPATGTSIVGTAGTMSTLNVGLNDSSEKTFKSLDGTNRNGRRARISLFACEHYHCPN